MFGRNPCRVDGGVGTPVSAFPGGAGIKGFVYLVQCISDRNYAMRAFCLDGHPSACYVTYKPPRCINKNCTWLSPTNLNQHGSDLTIVDSCHTDLTNPTDGESCLTTANLLAACSAPGVRVLLCEQLQRQRSNKHRPVCGEAQMPQFSRMQLESRIGGCDGWMHRAARNRSGRGVDG